MNNHITYPTPAAGCPFAFRGGRYAVIGPEDSVVGAHFELYRRRPRHGESRVYHEVSLGAERAVETARHTGRCERSRGRRPRPGRNLGRSSCRATGWVSVRGQLDRPGRLSYDEWSAYGARDLKPVRGGVSTLRTHPSAKLSLAGSHTRRPDTPCVTAAGYDLGWSVPSGPATYEWEAAFYELVGVASRQEVTGPRRNDERYRVLETSDLDSRFRDTGLHGPMCSGLGRRRGMPSSEP